MGVTRSSYAETRELLRWRVALVLVALMSTLMLALGFLNASLGLADTARLAWIVFTLNGLSLLGLLFLPRRVGSVLFFGTILGLVIFAVGFGWWHGRPLHYWGYLFPVVVVFLLPAWRAMAAMLVFGLFAAGVATTQLPSIEVVRFLSVYGLMVCFVTTYALLEERAGRMLRELSDRDGLTRCLNRRRFRSLWVYFWLTSTTSSPSMTTEVIWKVIACWWRLQTPWSGPCSRNPKATAQACTVMAAKSLRCSFVVVMRHSWAFWLRHCAARSPPVVVA